MKYQVTLPSPNTNTCFTELNQDPQKFNTKCSYTALLISISCGYARQGSTIVSQRQTMKLVTESSEGIKAKYKNFIQD